MANKDFYIQKGGYLQFDATTIEQYIKDILNDPATQTKFTDQNFEGSYFSSLIEIVSYTFNALMFYLNQTSSEAMFSDAQLYENMNRIVKMLGYNPIGNQTSLLPYTGQATDGNTLNEDSVYYIPRYSFLNIGGTSYSFNKDIVFKGTNIEDAVAGDILYQGKFREYPLYTAEGEDYEIVFLTPGDNVIIDHFNIYVYVKRKDGEWKEWTRSESLILAEGTDEVYEARYNESEKYEIKFGNQVNGQKLTVGDEVAIYYLESDGVNNDAVVGDLKAGIGYVRFSSPQFTDIYSDIADNLNLGNLAPPEAIELSNDVPSTPFSEPETTEEIRTNAPQVVKERNTLARTEDFERYIKSLYSNVVSDVVVMDNTEYMDSYLKYFYNLGIDKTSSVSRILFNQVNYADSCNFNNLYGFIKPKIKSSRDFNAFLSPALKQLVVNGVDELKLTTTEFIPQDPVYMAIDIGVNELGSTLNPADALNSEFIVTKSKTSLRGDDAVKSDINDVFQTYFNQQNTTLGMEVSFPDINDALLQVDGVVDFRVQQGDYFYSGLSFITWNEIYVEDISVVFRSKFYEKFQVPYLYNSDGLLDKIKVEVES